MNQKGRWMAGKLFVQLFHLFPIRSHFIIPFAFLGLFLPFFTGMNPVSAQSASKGILESMNGAVSLAGPGTQPARLAHRGEEITEGERIHTGPGSTATLLFFDDSRMDLRPLTGLSISQITTQPNQGKILRFKLALGSLMAKVTKLLSAHSAFEIEAGGVVCGVRGTQYSMDYDPGSEKLNLKVDEGSVYAQSHGVETVLNAGEKLLFIKGTPSRSLKPAAGRGGAKMASGIADPVFIDMHNQFAGGIHTYQSAALNDPDAFGLRRLNGTPVTVIIVGAGPPVITNPPVIYANP
jgi:hypothetical protein